MARAYSFDLRSRVLDAIDGGLLARKAAKRFNIGVARTVRWHRAWRDHGERVARKVSGIREMIESAGANLLYLPPYSPDFNPIEMAFSKLKAFLRKAAARTKEELDEVIAQAIEHYPAKHCENDFKACGYEPV